VLSYAERLVFTANAEGNFYRAGCATGKPLWHFQAVVFVVFVADGLRHLWKEYKKTRVCGFRIVHLCLHNASKIFHSFNPPKKSIHSPPALKLLRIAYLS